jgi:hypothetical protein
MRSGSLLNCAAGMGLLSICVLALMPSARHLSTEAYYMWWVAGAVPGVGTMACGIAAGVQYYRRG